MLEGLAALLQAVLVPQKTPAVLEAVPFKREERAVAGAQLGRMVLVRVEGLQPQTRTAAVAVAETAGVLREQMAQAPREAVAVTIAAQPVAVQEEQVVVPVPPEPQVAVAVAVDIRRTLLVLAEPVVMELSGIRPMAQAVVAAAVRAQPQVSLVPEQMEVLMVAVEVEVVLHKLQRQVAATVLKVSSSSRTPCHLRFPQGPSF